MGKIYYLTPEIVFVTHDYKFLHGFPIRAINILVDRLIYLWSYATMNWVSNQFFFFIWNFSSKLYFFDNTIMIDYERHFCLEDLEMQDKFQGQIALKIKK